MQRAMGELTVLTKATPKGDSLRTTVPMSIVRQFGLKEGDEINWQLKVQGGEMVIVAKPIKKG